MAIILYTPSVPTQVASIEISLKILPTGVAPVSKRVYAAAPLISTDPENIFAPSWSPMTKTLNLFSDLLVGTGS